MPLRMARWTGLLLLALPAPPPRAGADDALRSLLEGGLGAAFTTRAIRVERVLSSRWWRGQTARLAFGSGRMRAGEKRAGGNVILVTARTFMVAGHLPPPS